MRASILKTNVLSLGIGLGVAMGGLGQNAVAQQSFVGNLVNDLLDNYIMLTPKGSLVSSVDEEGSELGLEIDISLQAPNVSAKSFARITSANGGFAFPLVDGGVIQAGASVGTRGGIDFDQGIFRDGLHANNGIWGLTPTIGGNMYVGTDHHGVLLESELGDFGPKPGWQGSATWSSNLLDNVPTPYNRQFTGLAEVFVGASVSVSDETYAQAHWSTPDPDDFVALTDDIAIGLESLSVGAMATYDFGGLRLAVPLTVRQYFGTAAEHFGEGAGSEVEVGFSLGFRFN